jgi:CheY-like chemotaxis protein/anti-sigma regulatory factor (Ser/Thr protein kinase)
MLDAAGCSAGQGLPPGDAIMTPGTDPSADGGSRVHVLVVDDSSIDRRLAGGILEQETGWHISYAEGGQAALDAMAIQLPTLVLTDLQMPDMDGLQLVETIRQRFPLVPVILMTRHGSDDIAFRALKSGAASYVPKRLLAEELVSTLESVVAAAEVDQRRRRLSGCLTQSETYYTLDNDPKLVPGLVAVFQEHLTGMGISDETGCIRIGIALEEALVNAMYHGNLEVSSQLKRESEKLFKDTVEKRRHLDPYRQRRIFVYSRLSRTEATYIIRDEGPGFDPTSLPDPTDPANLEETSGRGLLLIRTFMDEVRHNERGNEITMIKRRDQGGAKARQG